MKPTCSLATLLILASSLAVACVGEPTDSADPETAEAPSEAEQALESGEGEAPRPMPEGRRPQKKGKMGHHARGPMAAFMKGLGELELSESQEATLKELRSSLREGKEGEGHGALGKALAPAIAAGDVTVAGFDAELDAIEARAEARALALQKALNTLHATLSADQRVELVDSLSDGRQGRRGKRGKGAGGRKIEKPGRMLGMLTDELDLTDAQIAQLEALEPAGERLDEGAKRDEMRAKMQALATAFKSDTFDAAKLGVGDEMKVMARAKAERMIDGLEKLVPILDDGQRAELAKMVESRALQGKKARGKRGARPRFDAPQRRR